jgi:hypothetical protein
MRVLAFLRLPTKANLSLFIGRSPRGSLFSAAQVRRVGQKAALRMPPRRV